MLHNAEEGYAFPRYGEPAAGLLRRLGVEVGGVVDGGVFYILLGVATLVPVAIVAAAAVGRSGAFRDALVRLVAWVFLLNVLFPHVIAAVLVGGYTPGLLSAVGVNLPLMSAFLLADARRNDARRS